MFYDYIAGGLGLLGDYVLGNRCKHGFLIKALANAVWVLVAILTGLYGLLAVAALATLFNICSFIKYRKGLR